MPKEKWRKIKDKEKKIKMKGKKEGGKETEKIRSLDPKKFR